MKNILYTFLLCLLVGVSYGQKSKVEKISFDNIIYIELDPETNEPINDYQTTHHCTFTINTNSNFITFIEKDMLGKTVNSWVYKILKIGEIDIAKSYICVFLNKTIYITITKDHSLVSIADNKNTFLITDANKQETNKQNVK